MALPLHSKLRRKLRKGINSVLSTLFSKEKNKQKIDPTSIQRILIIRINYRIGNVVFMTPLINALHKRMPDAKIDMLIGAPFIAPIIEGMPNIQNVYSMPRKLLKNPIKLFQYIQEVNKNNYDLIISPTSNSSSTNLATFLLKADLKLGFQSEDSYAPINTAVNRPQDTAHEALMPLALMEIFLGEKIVYDRILDILLSDSEKQEGANRVKELFTTKNIEINNAPIVAIFRDARYDKKIQNSWWIEFIQMMQKMDDRIIFLDILAPNETESILPNIASIATKNLRDLAKIFSAADIFISADTGPMHLASASLTPVIAFFNATNPGNYGPLGKDDKVIDINNKEMTVITEQTHNYINTILQKREK